MKQLFDPVWHLEAKLEAAVARGVRWSTPAASGRVPEVRTVPKVWSALQACDAISVVFDLWRVLSTCIESSSLFVTLPDLVKFTFVHTYQSSFLATAKLSEFAAAIDQAATDVQCASQASTRCHLFLRLLNERDMRCITYITLFLQKLVPTGFDGLLQLICYKRRLLIPLSGGKALLKSLENSCPTYETTDIEIEPIADGFAAMVQTPDSQRYASLFNEVFVDSGCDTNVLAAHETNMAKEAKTKYRNVAAKKSNHGTTKRYGQASKCMMEFTSEIIGGPLVDLDMLLIRIYHCLCPGRANNKLPALLPDVTRSKGGLPDDSNNVPYAGAQCKKTHAPHIFSHDRCAKSNALLPAQLLLTSSDSTVNSSNDDNDRRAKMMHHPSSRCENATAHGVQTHSRAIANLPEPPIMPSPLNQDTLPTKEKPNLIQDDEKVKRPNGYPGCLHSEKRVDVGNNISPMMFVCSKRSLRNTAEAVVSFEELRAVAFVLKCKRMTTVTFRLLTGRSITLRCTAVETAFEVRKRICDLLNIAMMDANLVACDSAPMRDDTFICRKANHNNSTVWVLPDFVFSHLLLARPVPEGVVSAQPSETSCFGKATMTTTATLWRKTLAVVQSAGLSGGFAGYPKPVGKLMPMSNGVISSAHCNKHGLSERD